MRGRATRVLLASALGALAVAVLAPCRVRAGDRAAKDLAAEGKLLYRIHCTKCHGESGTGDGPQGRSLKARPADLTRLGADTGGSFPEVSVREVIDGRRDLASHGERERIMPVWGLTFQMRGADSAPEGEVKARIDALVAYLRTLQSSPEDPADDGAGHPSSSSSSDPRSRGDR